ncbi:MAG: aminopeptidase P family protein [Alphaproteobacteria bacterium]|nr:aminopeptidase P family protein [Alphaproteobacteria bacterium]
MAKSDFPREEFLERQQRVRRAIADAGLDWLLVFHPVSIHWLIGSDAKSYQAFQCLLVAADAKPLVIITRGAERQELLDEALIDDVRTWGGPEPEDPLVPFGRLLDELGVRGKRVGMEVPAYYLHPHHYVRIKEALGKALVAEPTNLIHDLKLVKSPREIAYVREASRIADLGMAACIGAVKEGCSELEISGAVYNAMLGANGGLPASTINLVTGERLGLPHGAPSLRRLKRGDGGNVEFGATHRRYTVTIGRQFCLGEPTRRMRELYDIVRRASDAMIAAIRPGVRAVVPHEAAKKIIADAGYDQYRLHTSGYGIAPGFPPAWGEPINMFGGSPYTIAAGMVLSVEPPIFIGPEKVGARIIDDVLVTDNGAELLSRYTRDLIVVA